MVSSNERIDHAAEARRELEFTESQFRDINGNPSGVGFEKALVAATQAQVHATLALVEQQRIVAKLTVALVEQIGALAQTQTQPGYPSDPMLPVFEYLTDDERKGLGL